MFCGETWIGLCLFLFQGKVESGVQTLKNHGITQSMSRKGNCLDNAVIENFFGTLKEEIFYEQTKFTSLNELKKVIDEYIHYYNYDRIKTKLKGLSPVKFKEQYRDLVLGQTT
ncbi:Integrase core domain [Moraxella lacunata]|uniref:Integrase core domain n=1 Tax=Moraxella lacunata TaxID=477 RepID=A0A378TUR6_MORLA|nr:Integrase core domain [Moraxella lacunata]